MTAILFSDDMVRAILAGRKTQTRLVVGDRNSLGNVKPSRCDLTRAWMDPGPSPAGNAGPYLHAPVVRPDDGVVERIYPAYWPRKRLWVREAWLCAGVSESDGFPVHYRADVAHTMSEAIRRWRSSIHMPRWASRLTLEVTEVRAERIRDISLGDALAEGCCCSTNPDEADDFRNVWNRLNAKRGHDWEANPWVWALTFRRVDG